MKRSVLIAFVIVCSASMAFAQAGSIGVFADAGATDCNIVDGASLVTVFFVHVNTTGATASQWMLDLGGLPWTHLGDIMQAPTVIGTSVGGISLGYGGCRQAPYLMGQANFFGSSAPACSRIQIVADPLAPTGGIEGVDCLLPPDGPNKNIPTGGTAIVNSNGECLCNVPVEESTWGGIKALYQ